MIKKSQNPKENDKKAAKTTARKREKNILIGKWDKKGAKKEQKTL